MFVDIQDFKGAIAIENILTPYKSGRLSPDKKTRLPKEKITPQVCMEILRSTNYARNIEDMLLCIAELPASEQAQFKDVVLATFSNREQPNKQPHNIVLLGRKLAAALGYDAELAEAQKIKDGNFVFSAPKLDKAWICLDNFFSDVDFSAYDKVVFLSYDKIQFGENVKFPKILEMPNSLDVAFFFYDQEGNLSGENLSGTQNIFFKEGAKVDLRCVKNLPENLDFSQCDEVNLSRCSLLRLVNLRFKEGAKVSFSSVKNLPANLDVSMCGEVDFSKCSLLRLVNLRFKEGAKVNFSSAKSLPANLDVSKCSEVNFSNCDLDEQTNLAFKDGAVVNLGASQNLPKNLDVSNCSDVKLFWCNLAGISNLTFKDGAKVDLNNAYNLSENLDVSMCSEVDLEGCNLSGLNKLVFKNRQQMEESHAKLPDGWKGKLVFADEQEMSALGLAVTTAKTKGGR